MPPVEDTLDASPVPRSSRGRWVLVLGVIALGLAVLAFALTRSDGSSKSLADVEDAAWASCFVFQTSSAETYMDEIWQQEHDEKITAEQALYRGCGVTIARVDGGWTAKWTPDNDPAAAGFYAIEAFGEATGCLEDLDSEKLGSTRALDGRVESTSGRSSWTFHPDSGLVIICED